MFITINYRKDGQKIIGFYCGNSAKEENLINRDKAKNESMVSCNLVNSVDIFVDDDNAKLDRITAVLVDSIKELNKRRYIGDC